MTIDRDDMMTEWLNKIQAVGAGALEGNGRLIYSLYEVVLTAA